MPYAVAIAKVGQDRDVVIDGIDTPRDAWNRLMDELEKGQDDVVEAFTDSTPVWHSAEYRAYQDAIEAAWPKDWTATGDVTVDVDGGLNFAVIETTPES